jgi:flap endonuclease-1
LPRLALFVVKIHSYTFNSEDRVRKGAEKLSKFLNAKQQGRLDGFFTVKPKANEEEKDIKGGKGKDVKGGKRKVSRNQKKY